MPAALRPAGRIDPTEIAEAHMSNYPDLQLYIDGTWRKTSDSLPIVNPVDESVIGAVPVATERDLDDALTAAANGLKVWSRTAPSRRADIIRKAAALMRERVDEIALDITREHGKPFRQAQLEVIRGCEFFEWDAGEAQRLYGRVIPSEPGIRYVVHHQPIGTVAAFSPWNFPMSQPSRKVAGALAAGCSIILKGAEETPAGALHIARAFHDAGLPAGVLNLVFGVPARISEYLIPQDQVRLIAFTGSTTVGKHLAGLASRYIKPVLMELGGMPRSWSATMPMRGRPASSRRCARHATPGRSAHRRRGSSSTNAPSTPSPHRSSRRPGQ